MKLVLGLCGERLAATQLISMLLGHQRDDWLYFQRHFSSESESTSRASEKHWMEGKNDLGWGRRHTPGRRAEILMMGKCRQIG